MISLVKIDVAAVDLRLPVARIEELADGGRSGDKALIWVFDLATDPAGKMRSLRFWRPELLARSQGDRDGIRHMELNQVIAAILPKRRGQFHAGELDELFQIRRPTRSQLRTELSPKRIDGRNIYHRTALADFLNRRWLGHMGGGK